MDESTTRADGEDLNISGRITARGIGGGEGSPAIWGHSDELDGTGVQGDCDNGTNAAGVYGQSSTGWAGWFNGSVLVQQNIRIDGDLQVHGTKAAVARGRDATERPMYAIESPDCWFEDVGFGQLNNGRAEVTLDNEFVSLVGDGPYHVFLSEYDANSGIHVHSRNPSGFEVIGAEAAASEFSYRVVAKRYDVEVARFDEVPPSPAAKRSARAGQTAPDAAR